MGLCQYLLELSCEVVDHIILCTQQRPLAFRTKLTLNVVVPSRWNEDIRIPLGSSILKAYTKLDRLLASISPQKTIVEIYNRANEAINTFQTTAAQITNWDTFRYCMAELLQHVDSCALRLRGPVDVPWEYYWGDCIAVLHRIYGPSGEKAAFEMARTGNEGGLYSVLKAVAMNRAEEYIQNEISSKIIAYLESLSVDEQLDACSEYILKYGHLLPSEITEANAVRIRANFRKVLEKHPRLLLKFQGVGR